MDEEKEKGRHEGEIHVGRWLSPEHPAYPIFKKAKETGTRGAPARVFDILCLLALKVRTADEIADAAIKLDVRYLDDLVSKLLDLSEDE